MTAVESMPLWKKIIIGTVHVMSVLSLILVISWFSRVGFSWATGSGMVFSWHPVLMIAGLVVCNSQALVLYRWFPFEKKTQKYVHAALHCLSAIFTIVALVAVFRFHNESTPPITNLYSLHSWIGLLTVIVYFLQFVLGFSAFLFPRISNDEIRAKAADWHGKAGVAILSVLVAATVVSGILEKLTFTKQCNGSPTAPTVECYTGNALGLVVPALCIATCFVIFQSNATARNVHSYSPLE